MSTTRAMAIPSASTSVVDTPVRGPARAMMRAMTAVRSHSGARASQSADRDVMLATAEAREKRRSAGSAGGRGATGGRGSGGGAPRAGRSRGSRGLPVLIGAPGRPLEGEHPRPDGLPLGDGGVGSGSRRANFTWSAGRSSSARARPAGDPPGPEPGQSSVVVRSSPQPSRWRPGSPGARRRHACRTPSWRPLHAAPPPGPPGGGPGPAPAGGTGGAISRDQGGPAPAPSPPPDGAAMSARRARIARRMGQTPSSGR
jgi:translation initiation factor IF-2